MAHKKTFYLYGGTVFSSLEKLSKELQDMSDDVFKHHVNGDKHDFKEWVRNSLKKDDLADKIEDKIDKLELELEILRYLVHEDSKGKKKVVSKKKVSSKKELSKKGVIKKECSKEVKVDNKSKVSAKKPKKESSKKEVVKKEKVSKK